MLADIVLSIAQVLVFVYDVVTYPIYHLLSKHWSRMRAKESAGTPRPYLVQESSEEVRFTREKSYENPTYKEIIIQNKVDTVTKAFDYAVRKHGNKQCLGTREVLAEEDEMQDTGKSIYVSTLYTNLGDEAIVYGINETEVTCVVTSYELLPKFKTMLKDCPKVHTLIVMEDQLNTIDATGFKDGVSINTFKDVVALGASSRVQDVPPNKDDTAIIMYTSGSTGTPKGVILTHENLIATSSCIMYLDKFNDDDVYIAYLPLAHVLELLSECTMMMFGIPVGYSSPNTMTDMSTKVKRGQKGDASVLKPTLMCVVPLILDRIYKNIVDSVAKRGKNFQKVFDFCYRYKLYWTKSNKPTPIVDKVVFNKIKALLGGRMRFAITGGAPLSPETHEFIRTCLGITLVQGYSMTETTCSGTCMEPTDDSVGRVGPPMAGIDIKLVNWEEGNYRVTDRPHPRGEICIGGPTVAKGYFKLDKQTEESFFEEGGKRWFRSGDIGVFDKSGNLQIIDRKKDLVKLQLGEYVSLGKVESQLKTHPLVENICVYADSFQSHTVAIMVPIQNSLIKLAQELGKASMDYESLCKDNEMIQAVLKTLAMHGKKCSLEKFEMPTKITLSPEIWTPESGLVTAAFKLKRKCIQALFQPSIDEMYSDIV